MEHKDQNYLFNQIRNLNLQVIGKELIRLMQYIMQILMFKNNLKQSLRKNEFVFNSLSIYMCLKKFQMPLTILYTYSGFNSYSTSQIDSDNRFYLTFEMWF